MDKRRYERLAKDVKISYTLIAKVDSTPFEFGNSVMTDISKSGLAMLVDMPIPVPMLMQLQLSLPSRPTGMFVLGKSIYCTPVEDIGMYRIGIKFVGILPPDIEDAIQELRGPKRMSARS